MNNTHTPRRGLRDSALAITLGALLAIGVLVVHVKDQGGFPGDKDPSYMKVLYYVLEAACVVAVALLLSHRTRVLGWLLAVGVAAGPVIGYILSRGPGLPDAMDDRGNWTETLGVVSLVVEGVLLLLALAALAAHRRHRVVADDTVYETEPSLSRGGRTNDPYANDEIRSRR